MNERLVKAVNEFVNSCERDYEFPCGGNIPILTSTEEKLINELMLTSKSSAEIISVLANDFDWNDCYTIVIYGVRLAITAVRKTIPSYYDFGVLALAAGSPNIDSRDVLGALAIFENCGKKLNLNLNDKLLRIRQHTNHTKFSSVIESYFLRPEKMRSVEVMGFVESGSDEELFFKANNFV